MARFLASGSVDDVAVVKFITMFQGLKDFKKSVRVFCVVGGELIVVIHMVKTKIPLLYFLNRIIN